ncbi:SusC/RagA family TonB-linked outer membrane protein [Pedobacter metabolipauper]|uniref:TonB-linked SusC/RagA family outer membrane protein n=1 Tax=Pedobacter metabolipauper TaxID=425513 RepID=A0A4R6SQP8_9SPHI|nr:SusC/RagA family TonB-linked outer membrane protein [Pedobacter metabolipauper]TDQ06366.1 TonB-linked SusC/RagA family outer membrane protein [Pedobacter metabolipauper]
MRFIATITFSGLLCLTTSSFGTTTGYTHVPGYASLLNSQLQTDTAKNKKADTSTVDTALLKLSPQRKSGLLELKLKSTKINPEKLLTYPAVSIQQYLKGQAAGLYVQETSGEPGTMQNMFMHGTSQPLFSAREQFQTQPLIVLDGVTLVGEHPFSFDIQQYKFNRIGPATNLLTNIDMENIASIEVLTDIAAIAAYGPRGINGVIVLVSKTPDKANQIAFNSFFSVGQRPQVTTINGKYENAFRKQFYDKYTAAGRFSEDDTYPLYLSDSLSNSYYGPSNWTDLYYRNSISHNVNAAISGGVERANFRFSLGNVRNQGVADKTVLNRYSTQFNINMKPLQWLTFSALVNGNRVERLRNRNQRDRFGQMNYVPDLSTPLSPNKEMYGNFLSNTDNGFDDNKTNILEGSARMAINVGTFSFASRFGADYNEGYRDLFYPKTLLEGNSYASNYYGFNQRLIFDNTAMYDLKLNSSHNFHFELGQSITWDTYKYNYGYAYKGFNEFIKLNLLDGGGGSSAFPKQLLYKFLDKTENNLLSFYGRAVYNFKDNYTLSALVRADASSNAQPTSRWFVSPVLSAAWNVKNELLSTNDLFNQFSIRVSAGRLGRIEHFDNSAQGPQYTAELGFTGNITTPGYNAFAGLTRPYTYGWVGYGIPWAYADQLNIGTDISVLKDRLRLSVDFYTKTDKNQLLGLPSYAEYGYTQSFESGMSVNNKGIDLTISGDVFSTGKFSWTPALNLNFNANKLMALPRNLDQIIINDKMLKVGEPIDQYWLFTNEGIYTSDADVPVVNGVPMKYNGITLKAGDPKWKDLNGDNAIDFNDKSLNGNALPKVAGGFNNDFKYGNWNFGVNLYFNIGRQLINQEMANRFDFINQESGNTINSVKEITFWEKRGDFSKYPIYNPWSTVIPYRIDQDLFLENASFLKLRTVTAGYDLSSWFNSKSKRPGKLYVYATANNLFTLTNYTGQDPELVSYTGYDNGYGMTIPKTYTLGIRLGL